MRALGRWALWSLIAAIAIAGLLRASSLRWWRVPSDDPYLEASVAPTLRGGDWVLLWRLTPPALGSLVLCPEPQHPERVVLGRMVGDERAEVRVDGSRVVVNEKPFHTEGDCAEQRFTVKHPQSGAEVEQKCSLEAAHGTLHERGDADAVADIPRLELSVGEKQVVLVSDNRRFPYDSRDYGVVERESCKEMVFFRLWGATGFFDSTKRFQYIR